MRRVMFIGVGRGIGFREEVEERTACMNITQGSQFGTFHSRFWV